MPVFSPFDSTTQLQANLQAFCVASTTESSLPIAFATAGFLDTLSIKRPDAIEHPLLDVLQAALVGDDLNLSQALESVLKGTPETRNVRLVDKPDAPFVLHLTALSSEGNVVCVIEEALKPSPVVLSAPSKHFEESLSKSNISRILSSSAVDLPTLRRLGSVKSSFVITDPQLPDNPIVFASEGFTEMTGYTVDEVMGRNCRFLQGPATDPRAIGRMSRAIEAGHELRIVVVNYRKSGQSFFNYVQLSPLRNKAGDIVNYVGIQSDVTESVDEARMPASSSYIPGYVTSRANVSVIEVDKAVSGVDSLAVVDEEEKPHLEPGQVAAGAPPSPPTQPDAKRATLLMRVSSAVERGLGAVFYRVGRLVGQVPWLVILFCVALVAASAYGFTQMTNESRGERLWVPYNAIALKHNDYFLKTFSPPPRVEKIILVPEDGKSNAISAEMIRTAFDLHKKVVGVTAKYDGDTLELVDLCSMAKQPGMCDFDGILAVWDWNATAFEVDAASGQASILSAINAAIPTLTRGVDSLLLGRVETNNADEVIEARAFQLTYTLENRAELVDGSFEDPEAEAWELKFIDAVLEFKSEEAAIYVNSQRSQGDEFGRTILADIPLLSIGYVLIVIYSALVLARADCIRSQAALSLAGVGGVIGAIVVSIGLSSLLGQLYGPVHTVLPFVLLGIGVDDVYIIANAAANVVDPRVRRHVPTHMGYALSEAGVSITVTSVTDFAAFALGSTTTLPALSSFCVYAAVGVVALFLLQILFFGSWLAIDLKRQLAQRSDCLPCIKPRPRSEPQVKPTSHEMASVAPYTDDVEKAKEAPKKDVLEPWQERSVLKRAVRRWIAPAIVSLPGVIVIVIISLCVMGVSIYGTTQLKQEFSFDSFLPSDSYLRDYLDANDKYFPSSGGVPFYLITQRFNYFERRADIIALEKTVTDGIKGEEGTVVKKAKLAVNWRTDFEDEWLPTSQFADTAYANETMYYLALGVFVQQPQYAFQAANLVWDNADRTSLRAARMIAFTTELDTADKQVDALKSIRAAVDKSKLAKDGHAFAFSPAFLFWEQYAVIGRELVQNLIGSLIAVLVVSLVLIGHPVAALLVVAMVGMTVIAILGFLFFWGSAIDSVVVVCTVLAVGLSVDYAAHIAHDFLRHEGTRRQRILDVLTSIGVSVFNGGFSTFLAVVVLAGSASFVFVGFFRSFFLTCLFGIWHGLFLLPAILSRVGPSPLQLAATE